MATEIDIAVTTTTYDVTIVAEPNEYIVNITTGGGGGNQTLAQTLVLGNQTGGENILINDADAIELENTSLLKKGTYDFGGDGGISRICSNQYEDMWQSGFRHVFDQSGFIRHSTNCFDVIPDSSFDNTLRFKIDSLWTLDNGTTYKCTDASTGAAVWEIYSVGATPNLQQVTDEGNVTSNDVIVRNPDDALKQVVIHRPDAGDDSAYVLAQYDADNAVSILAGNGQAIIGTSDNNGTSELSSLQLQIVTNDTFEMRLAEGKLILGSTIDQPQIAMAGIDGAVAINTDLLTANREQQIPDKDGTFAMLDDVGGGTVTSVGLTMPSAFTVTNSPITSSGDIAVTGSGAVSQYVRGDGSLANFPTSSGGGSSLSFYLNGSVSQGTFGGVAFKEMDRTPILGAGTDFTINANGYIQSFITDAGVPNQLEIPAGNWNFETFFSASSGGGSPSFYVELYKWDGATLSLIASSSATPENITGGTSIDLYVSALAVPQTTLLATDRLAVRIYVTHSGRTITLHTENSHLCQVITTFSTGLTALNGLTAQVQNLAVGTTGTDFGIVSSGSTHTFNIPNASAANRGLLTSADWTTFNSKASTAYVDAKVTDAIVDGVTTVAPSQNAVFDALALKTDKTDWVDYTAISTIVGWSSFTANKFIWYKIIDGIMFVNFYLEGTSNATTATFTLPNVNTMLYMSLSAFIINNGGITTNQVGRITVPNGSSTVTVNRDNVGIAFTPSGSKTIAGQFFIKL